MKKRFLKKKLWKTFILLFGIPLITWNCEDNTESMINNTSLKTVTKQEVSNLLSDMNKQSSIQKNRDSYVKYDINDLTYEDISNTDAKLAVIPCETKNKAEYSRILMLNIQGENHTVVFNMFPSSKAKKSEHFDGEITIATLQGEMLRAFKVQEGEIMSFYSSNSYASKNFDTNFVSSKDSENAECRQWCGHQASDPYCICNMQHLDEVVVSGSTSIEYISINDLYGSDAGDSSTCEVDCDNTWNSVQGGSSRSLDDCPLGKVKDSNNNCVCPEGYTEDKNGNCVKKPCEGDPVANPQIAAQRNSGINGGLYGTCTRYQENSFCNGIRDIRMHNGIDLLNPYGAPIFAMYDGTATRNTQRDKNGNISGAGHYVSVVSEINGETIRLVYFHLQLNNRASGSIRAGDIIGYQGTSGNLLNAINQNLTESHVHIKAQRNGKNENPLNHLATTINSSTGITTNQCKN